MMKLFCLLFFAVLCIAVGTEALEIVELLKPTDDISSHPVGSNHRLYKIRAVKGKKLIVNITEMNFNPGSYLLIRDSKWEEYEQYRKSDLEEGGLLLISKTRKMFIYHHVRQAKATEGFTAHYTTYWENGTCLTDGIRDDHKTSRSFACDTDALSPVASRCTVTYDCEPHFQQYSQILTCNAQTGEWDNVDVRCLARPEVVEQCQIDFDTMELDKECPIGLEKMQEYAESRMENNFDGEVSVARGLGRGCRRFCKIRKTRNRMRIKKFCRRNRVCFACIGALCDHINLRSG